MEHRRTPVHPAQETPLHFHSRLDGRDHTGQLIRNVMALLRLLEPRCQKASCGHHTIRANIL